LDPFETTKVLIAFAKAGMGKSKVFDIIQSHYVEKPKSLEVLDQKQYSCDTCGI